MKILFLSIFLLAAACTSNNACTVQDDKDLAAAQKDLTFIQLAQASHIVMQAFDHVNNLCHIPESQLPYLPQKWKAAIDARYEREKPRYLRKNAGERDRFLLNTCEKTCSCGVYLNFLEYLEQNGATLSSMERGKVQRMTKVVAKLPADNQQCIEGGEWFCSSTELKSMLKQ